MPIDRLSLRAFARDEGGAAAVVVALLLTVLLAFVAFGTDLAMLYRERARLQARSDLAALGTVADLNRADARLAQMLAGNDLGPDAVQSVQYGRYLRNPAIAQGDRFQPLDPGTRGINAVALRLSADAPLTFARILSDDETVPIYGAATASRTGMASFSLSSRLLGLDAGALSDLLAQSFGLQVALTVRDVEVLAEADIDTAALLQVLAARVGFDPLNPADVLTLRPRVSDLVRAMQAVLPADAAARLAPFQSLPATVDLEIAGLIAADDRALGLTLTDALAEIEINALDLLLAAAEAVDGTSAMALQVDAGVPGIVETSATLRVQDQPAASGWVAIGEEGTTLHSAAARLSLDVELAPDTIGQLGAGITATRLALPIHAELAGATATLTELSCATGDPSDAVARFSTAFRPLSPQDGISVAALYLGTLEEDALSSDAPIDPAALGYADFLDVSITIALPLLPDITIDALTLQIRSHVTVGQSQVSEIVFTGADLQAGDLTRRFGSGDLLATGLEDLLSPERTDIRVKPGQGGLAGAVVGGVVNGLLAVLPDRVLSALAAPIDAVVDTALATTGLELGQGELTLTGHHCETVRLVR